VAGRPRTGSGGHGFQTPISTFDKKALGRAKAKGKEKKEMRHFMAGWPYPTLSADHSLKIAQTLSPTLTCPLDALPKENKAKVHFFFFFFNFFHFIKCKVRKIKYEVEKDKRKMMDE
jgi:hypothetical protein